MHAGKKNIGTNHSLQYVASYTGVEKLNDNARTTHTSGSNKWDACTDVMLRELRLHELREKGREKRLLTERRASGGLKASLRIAKSADGRHCQKRMWIHLRREQGRRQESENYSCPMQFAFQLPTLASSLGHPIHEMKIKNPISQ